MNNTFLEKKIEKLKSGIVDAMFSMPDVGILLRDSDGTVLEINSGAEKMLGCKLDELGENTKSDSSLFRNTNTVETEQIEKRLKNGEAVCGIEISSRINGDVPVNYIASYAPVADEDGLIIGSVVVFRNIVEQSIATQKAMHLAALESAADTGIATMDIAGTIQEWNLGSQNILGYTLEEIKGKNIRMYIPESSYPQLEEIFETIKRGEHISRLEVVLRHKNGSIVYCSISYTPIYGADNNVTGAIAVYRDVSEKKRVERLHKMATDELNHAYRDTAAILNEIPAPICVVSKKSGVVLSCNSAFVGLCNAKDSTYIQGTLITYYIRLEERDDDLGSKLEKKLLKGVNFKCKIKRIDGRDRDIMVFSRSFVYNEQEAFAVHCLDLTSQQMHEQALKRAVREAEEASKLKSAFLANMSHEIRTPMNGILGFTELALDYGQMPHKIREYLEKIRTSTNGLLGVINSVLDISKIEAGKVELEQIPFCLNDVYKNCHNACGVKASDKGITLFFYSEPFVKNMLLGDPTKLTQALINLLSNAIKFTNLGIVKLLSIAERVSNDELKIYFEVRDSGIGMTSEQIERIFDPFIQGDNSTTRRYGGSGLGLSITKNLIELMGGDLKVESTIGVGSKFSFSLRFPLSGEVTENNSIEQDDSFEDMRPIFKGRALVCEDNTINQQVIREHLTRIGFDVTIVADGRQGVNIASSQMERDNPFDIILMDIHMPVMDGLEATKKLIQMGNKTPIIALTANVLTKDRDNYLSHGITDYIGKPFNAKELWACLKRYIEPVGTEPIYINEHAAKTSISDSFNDSTILNKEIGLKGAAYDEKLYARILSNFYTDNSDLYEKFTSALDCGDIKRAHMIVHTLKGVSALIGATALTQLTQSIEKDIVNGKTRFGANELEEFKELLNKVLLALEPFAKNKNEIVEINSKPDYNNIVKILHKLEPLVKVGDSKCLDYIEEASESLMTLGCQGTELIKQIEDFDFELAYMTIIDIKQNMEVQHG